MTALQRELDRWENAGRRPRLFLRDDDAVADTPELRRLVALCNRHAIPLLLASIPEPAEKSLGLLVRAEPLITGAVHGYAHRNHSPPGEKICELSGRRDPALVRSEMVAGRGKLADLFGGTVSGLLVPPWNRIHDPLGPLAAEAGFTGISAQGWGPNSAALAGGLATVNAHVDIMHWSGGRKGQSADWVLSQTAANLGEARAGDYAAVGVLTHHLVHDEQAWRSLETLMDTMAEANARWEIADMLIDADQA